MYYWPIICAACVILGVQKILCAPKTSTLNDTSTEAFSKYEHLENNIIDSGTEYDIKFNHKYGINPLWNIGSEFDKNAHKYTIINQMDYSNNDTKNTTLIEDNVVAVNATEVDVSKSESSNVTDETYLKEVNSAINSSVSLLVLPLLKVIRRDNLTEFENTDDAESATKSFIEKINETSTHISKFATLIPKEFSEELSTLSVEDVDATVETITTESPTMQNVSLKHLNISVENATDVPLESHNQTERKSGKQSTQNRTDLTTEFAIEINDRIESDLGTDIDESALPIFTELDYQTDVQVPEDYYDGKDLVPTPAPNTDALSVIAGLAGSVAETVAEKILPKGIFDLYKRMQRQNEAIEAERLRSREENGGLGQFGRGLLKSISSGLTRPLSQLMAGARDIGSLDSDRGFVGGLASGVAGVADSVASVASTLTDAFKDRVQAIFPGTLWCGDGHAAAARAGELGLFFLTDTCCRQHDACKLFIRAGDTRHGLTNTGLFTRSHCSCDKNFLNCLRKTNSLVSSQIGITYFNVLGPQCFRKAHPIVRCVRRTRITGQKCEEYNLDYSKPKMWQWFDSETF